MPYREYRLMLGVLFFTLFAGFAQASEQEVRQAIDAYVKLFNQHDSAAIAAMWVKDGVHIDRELGERTEGRDQIQADIAAAFKANKNLKLATAVDRVQFIKPDVASVDGRTILQTEAGPDAVSSFTAILVTTTDGWRIFSIEESPAPSLPMASEALRQLDWLVGKWVDAADEVRVETSVSWSANRTFLLRAFVVKTKESEPRTGTQIIGWDARSQQIRSWSFHSDGSFGEGTWSKNGNEWLIKTRQTLADGRAASGVFVLSSPSRDTISQRLVGREIEGEPQPASAAVISRRAESDDDTKVKSGDPE